MVTMDAWLSKVDEIAAEGPSYKLGHDGSDGSCDCIGLIIGAIRRAGGTWKLLRLSYSRSWRCL